MSAMDNDNTCFCRTVEIGLNSLIHCLYCRPGKARGGSISKLKEGQPAERTPRAR